MRRVFRACSLWAYRRSITVGSSEGLPTPIKAPVFGKRRRQCRKTETNSDPIIVNLTEEDASTLCKNKYGFIQKPQYIERWAEFYSELQRIKMSWSLFPIASGGMDLKVFDRSDGVEPLHIFKGRNTNKSSPIADFFEACGAIVNGSLQEENIFFRQENTSEALRIKPSERAILYPYHHTEHETPVMARSQCTRVSVDVSHINLSNGVVTPLFARISFQALCFAFLNSIPEFLKRTDIGVRNIDFVSRDQMNHFRFAWCYLRREAWMTPLELDEFDSLLPPK